MKGLIKVSVLYWRFQSLLLLMCIFIIL